MADEACWSDEKEENLVILWSENPCLFDIQSKDYSNRLKKEAAYQDIAAKLNMTSKIILILRGTRNLFKI